MSSSTRHHRQAPRDYQKVKYYRLTESSQVVYIDSLELGIPHFDCFIITRRTWLTNSSLFSHHFTTQNMVDERGFDDLRRYLSFSFSDSRLIVTLYRSCVLRASQHRVLSSPRSSRHSCIRLTCQRLRRPSGKWLMIWNLSNGRSRGATLHVLHAGRYLSITVGALRQRFACTMQLVCVDAVRLRLGEGGGVVGGPHQILIQVQ